MLTINAGGKDAVTVRIRHAHTLLRMPDVVHATLLPDHDMTLLGRFLVFQWQLNLIVVAYNEKMRARLRCHRWKKLVSARKRLFGGPTLRNLLNALSVDVTLTNSPPTPTHDCLWSNFSRPPPSPRSGTPSARPNAQSTQPRHSGAQWKGAQ
jgi:hypothetical protein